ncbi:hypothetical protein GGI12_000155 [Dipsacomyces acuminosporus]|nr:hypothetical protein GGI12_000155 [Dipsacomyces acuminosporus]
MNGSGGGIKRPHYITGEDGSAGGEKKFVLYHAAAEDDGLGWSIGEQRVDPMYTMQRRAVEVDSQSRVSFFKRLKQRSAGSIGGGGNSGNSGNSDNSSNSSNSSNPHQTVQTRPTIVGGDPKVKDKEKSSKHKKDKSKHKSKAKSKDKNKE